MTTFIFANNINAELAGGISSSETTITLNSTLNLPTSIPSGDVLALTLNDAATRTNFEIVYVTAISGATLTVERAQEGTSAKTWLTGDFAFSGPTAGQMENFSQSTSTGVTPGSYGSSTQVGSFTVNTQGELTAAANVGIAFPVSSFNGRAGAITLNTGDVTTALGFTPLGANIAASTLLGNPTGSSATPSAITLANGLVFSGTALGMTAITPTTVAASGNITSSGYIAAAGALYGSGLNPPTTATQGSQILWNTITVGSGYMEYVNNYGGGVGYHKWYERSATTGSATLQMTLDPSGNLTTVGGVTAGSSIFASSNVNTIIANNGGSGAVYIRPAGSGSSSGQLYVLTNGNTYASGTLQPGSDGRVKKNRKKITNALSEVAKLSGLIYERSDRENEVESGFIAQNVERYFPHLVTKNKEMNGFKNFRTLNYNGIVPYLANAINELHAHVSKTFRAIYADMHHELRERDKKIASLERRLEKIDKAVR